MRVPNQTQLSQQWRIHELVRDFTLEDVWVHPALAGAAGDFPQVLELVTRSDPAHSAGLPTRFLWGARDLLGRWFDLGGISAAHDGSEPGFPIPGTDELSLAQRLPGDLAGTAAEIRFGRLPFVPLYLLADEFAAEISNRTVHGVMHLAWVADGNGRYHGQMAVYVKPRGRFGRAYMAFIKPFRYLVVYPALERQLARAWQGRPTISA
jgi:hypothetical protein